MNRIRTAVLLSAVLLWAGTPAMACMLLGLGESTAESHCCHEMAAHCGQSAMPATHRCCQAPAYPEPVVTQGQNGVTLKDAIAALAVSQQGDLPAGVVVLSKCSGAAGSPPGEDVSCSSSVLRV